MILAVLLLNVLLDVPFLAQPPELCGGAAVAMVMRYWGHQDVFPQDFSRLVTAADGGIVTTTLVNDVRARGWQAAELPASGDNDTSILRESLALARPVIALIEVAPRVFHYVVVVGITADVVVVHDPARAPYRALPVAEFERAWAAASRWSLLLLPPAGAQPARAVAPTTAIEATNGLGGTPSAGANSACSAMVDAAITAATSGDAAGAERTLDSAIALCPHDAAPRRELAGLRFAQSRWSDAAALASRAARIAPDTYTWQLAASSYFMSGARMAALSAWNRAGEPLIDVVSIHGLTRTPQPVVLDMARLTPRSVLTVERLAVAGRRVRSLPIAEQASISYEPLDASTSAPRRATIAIAVRERPMVPQGWRSIAVLAARAAVRDEVRIDSGGLLGRGDAAHVAWRWTANRPRVEVGVALPSPHPLPGVLSVDFSHERQSYATTDGRVVESRRGVGLSMSDWWSSRRRWQSSLALDVFDNVDHVAAGGTLEQRLADDRLAFTVEAHRWWRLNGRGSFSSIDLVAAWRSDISESQLPAWTARAATSAVSTSAPLALWNGAGINDVRGALLRAHRLLSDGVVTGNAFGRRLASASVEHTRSLATRGPGTLSGAVFVDAAQATRGLSNTDATPVYVDIGVGLRLGGPMRRGTLRVDLAHGLRGGGATLSAGWMLPWS